MSLKPGGLRALRDLDVRSVSVVGEAEVGLSRDGSEPRLAALAPPDSPLLARLEGDRARRGDEVLLLGPAGPKNLDALRGVLPWLVPRPLGLGTSAGMGDRLGLATPGHVRAMRSSGAGIGPIFAQQSIREMERAGRTPRQVMDDAAWGVFAEDWRDGFGADADHLKTAEHVDACAAAGYTFFTFDPGDRVDDRAGTADPTALRALFDGLPWDDLEDTPGNLLGRYPDASLSLDGHEVPVDGESVARAAVKYGRAVVHAAYLYRRLESVMGKREFEVEVSVDETESPTTHVQHLYIVRELSRLGVRFVSLAPRLVGSFEKGVDYLGDVAEFEKDLAVHAAIAREASPNGPYKLSLHSGSDKFSVYPAFVRQTRGLAHLKTAGTSYLEALRTAAVLDPAFFREVYALALARYPEDRASYHVSANVEKAARPETVEDAELPLLLDRFDEREILHVTFGSVLDAAALGGRLFELLREDEEAYAANLESHFRRHLAPFASPSGS
ncbi:hypothetical protein GBA63_02140 [Rubrobacter tropicus]|uniref:Tagaturonate/fructuronate epimerase n=1 Tax=Rubrobacter tropicus TaxID=2653851 RepID=A0A6G8Q542_9ACTN|nr:tagaturonate epimerase family protein [Rubrobacter tropicus]QIN81558.1 hypothetical protein GBA63_02140 [Rubrobacter tropicus]